MKFSALKKSFFRMSGLVLYLLPLFFLHAVEVKTPDSPFKWNYSEKNGIFIVNVRVPDKHYLYAESTKVSLSDSSGKDLKPYSVPKGKKHHDQYSGDVEIFPGPTSYEWKFRTGNTSPSVLKLSWQGCSKEPFVCFRPMEREIRISKISGQKENMPPSPAPAAKLPEKLSQLLEKFGIERKTSGYMPASAFKKFLSGAGTVPENIAAPEKTFLRGRGALWVIIAVLFGGLMLNLTPCVLPMIPVNLAIIGAGSKSESKAEGFFRGLVYGTGIALAYGILGVFVVLTGARFGELNSMPWFNIGVAIVFLLLGLAMFDVFSIDFSRYGAKINPSEKSRGRFITVFFLGALMALLAGACVAPVVIAVLLYSSSLYAEGKVYGLFLPFLLGAGMALPWPFAGAGMALLPKPGKWMVRVKQAFGIFIILLAFYYAYLGVSVFSSDSKWTAEAEIDRFATGLKESLENGRPVLVDFWASWCKNCTAMEETVFSDTEIKKVLKNFNTVKFQAEKPNAPQIKAVLDRFGILGMPSFIILAPEEKNKN